MTIYRVECQRPDHPRPSLVGDFDDVEAAREAARVIKNVRRPDRLTVTSGCQSPPEPTHEFGHHFAAHDGDHPDYLVEEVLL